MKHPGSSAIDQGYTQGQLITHINDLPAKLPICEAIGAELTAESDGKDYIFTVIPSKQVNLVNLDLGVGEFMANILEGDGGLDSRVAKPNMNVEASSFGALSCSAGEQIMFMEVIGFEGDGVVTLGLPYPETIEQKRERVAKANDRWKEALLNPPLKFLGPEFEDKCMSAGPSGLAHGQRSVRENLLAQLEATKTAGDPSAEPVLSWWAEHNNPTNVTAPTLNAASLAALGGAPTSNGNDSVSDGNDSASEWSDVDPLCASAGAPGSNVVRVNMTVEELAAIGESSDPMAALMQMIRQATGVDPTIPSEEQSSEGATATPQEPCAAPTVPNSDPESK